MNWKILSMRLILLSSILLVGCSTVQHSMAPPSQLEQAFVQRDLPSYRINELECLNPDVKRRVLERDLMLEILISDQNHSRGSGKGL